MHPSGDAKSRRFWRCRKMNSSTKTKTFLRPDGRFYTVQLIRTAHGWMYLRKAKETHRCYRPAGWAFDLVGFCWAVGEGATLLRIDTEATIYETTAARALLGGTVVDFGCGKQVLVPLECWRQEKKDRPAGRTPEQLTFNFDLHLSVYQPGR